MKNNNNCLKHTSSVKPLDFSNPIIEATFNNGHTYNGPLNGLKEWAKSHKVGYPTMCSVNGERRGIYPCFELRSDTITIAMSVLKGVQIPVGETLLYPGREALRRDLEALRAGGVEPDPERLFWGITEASYGPVRRELI
jgi:hypothetical protein